MKTDDELRRDVEEELEWEPSVDHREIGVAVKDGVVALTGVAPTYSARYRAEWATERVAGVKGVANDIEVHTVAKRTDADIAADAVHLLEWNNTVPRNRVTVEVDNGWLTLKGEVDWQFERQAAEQAVRDLHGVKGVSNAITMTTRLTPGDVKLEIQRSFKRAASFDAAGVNVEVDGGEVTLSGTVHTWVERSEAERAAWRAPGVSSVHNLVRVDAMAQA